MKKRLLLLLTFCFMHTLCLPASAQSGTAKPILTFPVVSDIHVQSQDILSHNKFKAALQDLHQINPHADAMIINGDLSNGQPADYGTLQTILGNTPHPQRIFYTIGNHEFYKAWFDHNGSFNPKQFPNGETEAASIDRFLAFTKQKQVYNDTWIHGYHFIFLGSEQYRQSKSGQSEGAFLSDRQLNWLSTRLQEGSKKQPTFVFLHQPLPNTVSGSWMTDSHYSVVQHQELNRILSEHPEVILFSGHTHYELKLPTTLVKNKFTMVNSSSVNQPISLEDSVIDTKKSEGLYVEVYKNRVIIRGRDFYKKQWIPEAQYTIR